MGSLLLAAGIHTVYLTLLIIANLTDVIAGETGKRHCLPNASIMIHRECLMNESYSLVYYINSSTEPSGGASGQASDIAIHAKEILRVRRLLTTIYQRHCAVTGENEDEGLQRFGNFFLTIIY